MKRDTAGARAWQNKPRDRVSPVSSARKRLIIRARPIREAWLRFRPACEMSGHSRCFGARHVHEVWPRGRGGPLDDPRNFATLCDHHNTAASQEPRTMAHALSVGLLVTAAAGPAWLAAGGRFTGASRADVLALIGAAA